jgi:hypothetical protein
MRIAVIWPASKFSGSTDAFAILVAGETRPPAARLEVVLTAVPDGTIEGNHA